MTVADLNERYVNAVMKLRAQNVAGLTIAELSFALAHCGMPEHINFQIEGPDDLKSVLAMIEKLELIVA